MNTEKLRKICLSLSGATEQIQWEDDLVFKVGGKMFAVVGLSGNAFGRFSFKCSEERFYELTESPGILPAPYLARAHWISIDPRECSLSFKEIEELLRDAHSIVLAKLPSKVRQEISSRKRRNVRPR